MLTKLNVPFLGIVRAGLLCFNSSGRMTVRACPTKFVPFELTKHLNIFSVQKLQGAYSLFGDVFLRLSVQKLLGEGVLLLAGSGVWSVLEMNVIEDRMTPIVGKRQGQFWGVE